MAGGKRHSDKARLDKIRGWCSCLWGRLALMLAVPAFLINILAFLGEFQYACHTFGLEVLIMRFLLKILCAPVVAVLAI